MKFSELTLLAALVVFGAYGCADDDSGDAGGGETDTDGSILCGMIIGFGSDTPVPNMKVIVLDNDTGEPLGIDEKTSDNDGRVCIGGLPAGKRVGFKVLGVPGKFVDTYSFNIRSDAQNETIWAMALSTFTMSIKLAQVDVDPTKAIAAGGAYWLDEEKKEYPVECGTVEPISGEADMRYFNDAGLPGPPEAQSNLNRANGYWVAANMTPGKVTLQIMVDGEAVGRTTFHAFPGEAISIGNIEVDPEYTNNPGKCE